MVRGNFISCDESLLIRQDISVDSELTIHLLLHGRVTGLGELQS